MKRQGVRNGKYRVFGKVRRNVVHPAETMLNVAMSKAAVLTNAS
jgi:hypothetical protein